MALPAEEAEVGKRIRLVRKEQGISQRLAATQMGLSRAQVKRIERGEATVRFFPAWNFCRFTQTNPLWLALGGGEDRSVFVECANSDVPEKASFLDVMRLCQDRYRDYRIHELHVISGAAKIFPLNRLGHLTDRYGRYILPEKYRQVREIDLDEYQSTLDTRSVSGLAIVPSKWDDLARDLRVLTKRRYGAQADLARYCDVQPQAVTAWLSGTAMPSLESLFRLLEWVKLEKAKQARNAGRDATGRRRSEAKIEQGERLLSKKTLTEKKRRRDRGVARPAPTRKSKSTENERAKSSRGKH